MTFDRHLTSASRLEIMAALVQNDRLSFSELKKQTGLADGNLHIQTQNLEEAGYLTKEKGFQGNRSITVFQVSSDGLAAFELYFRKLKRIFDRRPVLTAPVSRREYEDESRVW